MKDKISSIFKFRLSKQGVFLPAHINTDKNLRHVSVCTAFFGAQTALDHVEFYMNSVRGHRC